MRTHLHGRRATGAAALALAIVLGACGASVTPAPTAGDSASTAGLSAGPTDSASPATSDVSAEPSPGAAASGPSASASAPASAPPSAAATSLASVAPLPAPGAAHAFSCASLLSNKQVTSVTRIPSFLFVAPPGLAPKPIKGQTVCKYLGSKPGPNKTSLILTTDVYVLTDGARSSFDANWTQFRGSSLVTTVTGVGDDAAWFAAQDTLIGISGAVAFEVTLEPSPLTIFTPESARAAATALARTVVSHL